MYIDKILEKFQLDKTNVVQTPRKKEVLFTLRIESETLASKQKQYHSITRSLMFSIMKTRLNIFFSSSVTSCFSKILLYQHIEDVKTIQHYLKGSGERSITYEGKKNLMIEEYSNSDWMGNNDSRKSTSSFIFMLNSGLVSWCPKKQLTVTLSSTEVEYIALMLAAKEVT